MFFDAARLECFSSLIGPKQAKTKNDIPIILPDFPLDLGQFFAKAAFDTLRESGFAKGVSRTVSPRFLQTKRKKKKKNKKNGRKRKKKNGRERKETENMERNVKEGKAERLWRPQKKTRTAKYGQRQKNGKKQKNPKTRKENEQMEDN